MGEVECVVRVGKFYVLGDGNLGVVLTSNLGLALRMSRNAAACFRAEVELRTGERAEIMQLEEDSAEGRVVA